MKIGALFSDYDGTLAPADVPKKDSAIDPGLRRVLGRTGRTTVVAIVTAKDFRFVYPRTRFARAWACAQGLDIRISGGACDAPKGLRDISGSLEVAESLARGGALLETKKGPGGRVIGFSLDWRTGNRPDDESLGRLRALGRREGFVVEPDDECFIDVFAGRPDKGKAVRRLREILRPKGGAMFIGDSPEDNPAYREVEVAVGVSHGQALDGLCCGYLVDQVELGGFLEALLRSGMEFSAGMPHIRPKEA